jgi:peptidoglycan/LPS O-acetylase OafA/YrhL
MFGAVLSERLQSDRNSFNLVRLAAAASVIVSHLFILRYGPGTPEPLSVSTPFTLGQHAVNVFFVLSGLLLSRSLDRNPDLRRFAFARLLRIVPGLFVYGLVFALVSGPLLTSMAITGYFTDIKTWTYPFTVLARFQQAPAPPGLFGDLPYASAVNEPLWTLKYEMAAYAGLAVAQAMGLRKSVPFLMLSLVLTAFGLVVMQPGPQSVAGAFWPYHLSRYGLCFLLGVLAHRGRDVLPVTPWLLPVSFIAAIAFAGTTLSPVTCIVATAHVAVVAGAMDFGPATRWTRRNDISYGTYIYGWPVQQALLTLVPGISLALFALLSFVCVMPLAIFSWSAIERPALNYRSGRAA